jgi:hypothetical protein
MLSDARVAQFRDSFKTIANRADSWDKPNVRQRQLEMAELLDELLELRSRTARAVAFCDSNKSTASL